MVYVRPPAQQELDAPLEELKREREKYEAELERKQEERLKAFPPELRKRMQERYRESAAKTRHAMSSEPCRVLNPPF
jgi:hypothetical protein